MKRAFSAVLLLSLCLALCGCSLPAALPQAAPSEAEVTPEPEEPQEEPGAGRILVHMRRDSAEYAITEGEVLEVSCYVPEVTIALREEAEAVLNEALSADGAAFMDSAAALSVKLSEGGACRRTVTVPREDKHILSLVYHDVWPDGTETVTGCTYSTKTGERLTYDGLFSAFEVGRLMCGEYSKAMTGREDLFPEDPAEGSWVLSDAGLTVFLAEGDFSFPYSVLFSALKEVCMPPEEETVRGSLRAAYTNDVTEELTELDELTVLDGFESLVLWADGEVRNVSAVRVEGEDFSPRELIWTCSRLMDGEAVRFNITLPETVPDLKLTWTTDKGNFEALLSRNGETGKAGLLMVVGAEEEDTAVPEGPYSHITAEGFLGHWDNGGRGVAHEAVSFQNKVCYVWNGERGLEGSCFLWSLVWDEDPEVCPRLVIYTGGENGDLVYTVSDLTDTAFTCTDPDMTFTKSEAVG